MGDVEDHPPPLVAALRRAVEELCVGRTDVTVEHDFVDEAGSCGWSTVLTPAGRGLQIWSWFDGFDRDLMLIVGDEYYFEWLDLSDGAAVVADVLGICSAVLSGRARARRAGMRRHVDVWAEDGRRWTGAGRATWPWTRFPGAARDGTLPGYGAAGGA